MDCLTPEKVKKMFYGLIDHTNLSKKYKIWQHEINKFVLFLYV